MPSRSKATDFSIRRVRVSGDFAPVTCSTCPPTNLGVMGHSWAARAAVRGKVQIMEIACIAGSWDENASIRAIIDAGDDSLPTPNAGNG